MALEGLYVSTRAPWYESFRSELLSFPAGKHDDQVDALGLVGQLLDRMIKGRKPDPKETREIKVQPWTWDDAFKAHRRALRRLRENGVEVSALGEK
jgi:hypothetical protein